MLLLNQTTTTSQHKGKGLVMEVFLEQVDNRVTVTDAFSNKVNTSVICHMKWKQCADDPAFIFHYF